MRCGPPLSRCVLVVSTTACFVDTYRHNPPLAQRLQEKTFETLRPSFHGGRMISSETIQICCHSRHTFLGR